MDILEGELINTIDDNNQIGIADVLNDFIISLDEYFRTPDRTKIPIGYDREINILTDNTDMLRKAFEEGRVPNQKQLHTIRDISSVNLSSTPIKPNTFEDPKTIFKTTINTKDDLFHSFQLCNSSISYLIENNLLDIYSTQYEESCNLIIKYEALEDSIKYIYNICKEYGYD